MKMKKVLRLTVLVALVSLLFIGLQPGELLADGTETLGPLSIGTASGSGIVAAGAGLNTQPGTISVDVPIGATVEQVLLYWTGQMATFVPGDDTIIVNGTQVIGTLIGGGFFAVEFLDVLPDAQQGVLHCLSEKLAVACQLPDYRRQEPEILCSNLLEGLCPLG